MASRLEITSIVMIGAVLPSCAPAEPDSSAEIVNIAIAIPEPLPQPETRFVEWSCDRNAEYDSIGNKWWAGFDACEGDIRIDVEADSVNLRGPALRFDVSAKHCPAGNPAQAGWVDRAFFLEPFDRQLVLFKRQIANALARLEASCGGPTDGARLLGPKFDRAFRDLAESKWLGLSKAKMQQSWDSDR